MLLISIFISLILTIAGTSVLPRYIHYIFKPLTMILIILLFLENNMAPFSPSGIRWILLTAFILSLLGDIFLMLPKNLFIPGLLSFLGAHLFFMMAFRPNPLSVLGETRSWIVLIVLLGIAGSVLRKLWKHLGSLKIPVFVYMLALIGMSWFAIVRGFHQDLALLIPGALLFVASDATLALNRFVAPVKNAQLKILGTYFLAQLCFTVAWGSI